MASFHTTLQAMVGTLRNDSVKSPFGCWGSSVYPVSSMNLSSTHEMHEVARLRLQEIRQEVSKVHQQISPSCYCGLHLTNALRVLHRRRLSCLTKYLLPSISLGQTPWLSNNGASIMIEWPCTFSRELPHKRTEKALTPSIGNATTKTGRELWPQSQDFSTSSLRIPYGVGRWGTGKSTAGNTSGVEKDTKGPYLVSRGHKL